MAQLPKQSRTGRLGRKKPVDAHIAIEPSRALEEQFVSARSVRADHISLVFGKITLWNRWWSEQGGENDAVMEVFGSS
jgi:hypothetical protein